MDQPNAWARDARRRLRALARPDVPSIRAVRRRFSRELAGAAPGDVLDFVRALIVTAHFAERLIAWEVLAAHKPAFAALTRRQIESMARGLADWGAVDLYGVTIAGPAWRQGLVDDRTVASWTRSPDRWRRRLALVATVSLNAKSRGGTGDARRTIAICRRLVQDRDDMVVKAMSWSLRELAKRDPRSVRAFLENEGPRLASRVRREVTNKLTTGLKTPR